MFENHQQSHNQFEKFISDLSNETYLSETLIENVGLDCIQKWEDKRKIGFMSIELLYPYQKNKELKSFMKILRKELKEFVPSRKVLESALEIAEINLEAMFSTKPSLFS
jgi:hypothetical protein